MRSTLEDRGRLNKRYWTGSSVTSWSLSFVKISASKLIPAPSYQNYRRCNGLYRLRRRYCNIYTVNLPTSDHCPRHALQPLHWSINTAVPRTQQLTRSKVLIQCLLWHCGAGEGGCPKVGILATWKDLKLPSRVLGFRHKSLKIRHAIWHTEHQWKLLVEE